jgi:hypothetical protein
LRWLARRKWCLVREAFRVGAEVEVRLRDSRVWAEARVVAKTRYETYDIQFKNGREEADVDPMRIVLKKTRLVRVRENKEKRKQRGSKMEHTACVRRLTFADFEEKEAFAGLDEAESTDHTIDDTSSERGTPGAVRTPTCLDSDTTPRPLIFFHKIINLFKI